MKQMELGLEGGESQLQKYIDEGNENRKAHRAKPEASSRPIPSATDAPKLFDTISPKGPSGGGGGGGGGMGTGKMNRDITKAYKKGGKVSSASKRADGCCIRGKTRA
jgi:hypothetical protein